MAIDRGRKLGLRLEVVEDLLDITLAQPTAKTNLPEVRT